MLPSDLALTLETRVKITETIDRECCDERKGDLKAYRGAMDCAPGWDIVFCIHCGQVWITERRIDSAGSNDTRRKRVTIGDKP
jgi:hypothetical protein